MLVAGGACFGVWLVGGVVAYLQMRNWEQVPATIVHAESKCISSSSNGNRYETTAEYRYQFQGSNYTGSRISLDDANASDFDRKAIPDLSKHCKSGQPFPCYVNPQQPAESILYRNLPWATLIFRGVFMLVFAAPGFGWLAWQRLARRRERIKAALALAHPDEPWLWNKAWAGGRIRSSTKNVIFPLLFTVVWNAISLSVWFRLSDEISYTDGLKFWLVLAFPVIGLVLMVWSVVVVLRWRKFGRSIFELAALPGVIGGQLAGVIRTPVTIESEDVFLVKLKCIRVKHTEGSESRTVRSVLWRDEQLVGRDLLQYDAKRSAIPVLFQIPYECRPSDDSSPDNIVYWSLEVSAKTPGIDFQTEFDVPVFKTPASDPNFEVDPKLAAEYAAPDNPQRDLRDAGVVKTPSPTGEGYLFEFPMARHSGLAVGVTLVTILLFGVPLVWMYLSFEWIAIPFGLVFGLIGLFMFIFTIELWFYRSVVDVSRDGMIITGGLFGRGTSRHVEVDNISRIKLVSNIGGESQMYYTLVVVCNGGEKLTVGKHLPGKRLATAVVRQIEEALGKQLLPVG